MPVFKQELNWSTYQDKQMKILESLSKSFSDSLQIGQHLAVSMNKIERSITSIANASVTSAKNIVAITEKFTGKAEKFSEKLDVANVSIGGFTLNLTKSGKAAEEFEKRVSSTSGALGTLVSNIWDHLGKLEGIGKEANNLSEMSNQLIRLSGVNGSLVKEFRSELSSIVSDLNRSTGGLYNNQEAYQRIISVSQGVTSNLEAIEEMSKPLLLTYETLDVNVNTVAELFNKFYTRYTFSSTHMEDTLDEIRGNTAGNSANAEATMENIKSLELWINNYAGNDNNLREELLERVSHYTSWLESMELDSKVFTDYLNAAAFGDWRENKELINILSRVNISPTQATDMSRSGQYEELTQAILDGVYDIMLDYYDNNKDGSIGKGEAAMLGASLDSIGLPRDLAMEVLSLKGRAAGYSSLEEFMANQSSNPASLEDLAKDKYVSAADKVRNNWLEKLYLMAANIQETLGFGFSDVALAIMLTKGVFNNGRGGASALLSGKLGTKLVAGANNAAANLMVSGSSIVGNQASVGLATGVGVAGVAAGGLLVADGVKGLFDKENDNVSKTLSGVEAGAGLAGAGLLLASNPIGWAVLVGGGLTYLGKKAYENATEFSGNAKEIENNLKDIGNSLQEENLRRIEEISSLRYSFDQADLLIEKRKVLEESGLFTREELEGKTEAQLKALIDEYANAAKAMQSTTEGILTYADKFAKEKTHEEQKEFVNKLSEVTSNEDRMNILSLLSTSITDEKLLEKIEKYQKDGQISDKEWNKILVGNMFNNHNLMDQAIDVEGMRTVAGYSGFNLDFTDPADMTEATSLYNKMKSARGKKERDKVWKEMQSSTSYSTVLKMFGDQLSALGYTDSSDQPKNPLTEYAVGTNYVDRDQLAILHEGEAVVPKKYNPAANNAELLRAVEYLQSSESRNSNESMTYLSSLVDELKDIRVFLAEWKAYIEQKERLTEARDRNKFLRENLLGYYAAR